MTTPDRAAALERAAEMLWVVLANVSGGDWKKQSQEWQDAAARWRDNYFAMLKVEQAAPESRTRLDDEEIDDLVYRGDAVLLKLGARLGMTPMEVCTMVNNEPGRPRGDQAEPEFPGGYSPPEPTCPYCGYAQGHNRVCITVELAEAREAILVAPLKHERDHGLDICKKACAACHWLALPAVQRARETA